MIDISAGTALGDGRYRLQRPLGAGGMASVWLAVDERLGRSVAVKVMADTLAGDARYRERFAREARAAASVSDPSIVPVYDYGIQDGRPYLVMEYMPDGNLATRLLSDASGVDGFALAQQLLDALAHIHDVGLIHRDIKPANIMLDRLGRARLTDFGIARAQGASSLTQTGMVIGSLRYLAPEIVEGAPASPASDLYAAGVVLREVTDRQPSSRLAPLIAALTAARPADRPSSATAAHRLLSDQPSPHEPAGAHATTATIPLKGATSPLPSALLLPPLTAATVRRLATSTIPRETRWAIGAMAAVIVVIALASHGSARHPAASASPAARTAPLADQLRALDNIITATSRR